MGEITSWKCSKGNKKIVSVSLLTHFSTYDSVTNTLITKINMFLIIFKFLEKNSVMDMNRENFSFSSRVLIGDFLQPTVGEEVVRLTEEQVLKQLEELKMSQTSKPKSK